MGMARLLLVRVPSRRGAAPGVGLVSHRWRWFGLPPSIRFVAGSPHAPRGPRYPASAAVRKPDGTATRGRASTGLSTKSRRPGGFVDNRGLADGGRRRGSQAQPTGGRAAVRSPRPARLAGGRAGRRVGLPRPRPAGSPRSAAARSRRRGWHRALPRWSRSWAARRDPAGPARSWSRRRAGSRRRDRHPSSVPAPERSAGPDRCP